MVANALAALPCPDAEAVTLALAKLIGRKPRWISKLAKKYSHRFSGSTRPTANSVHRWLIETRILERTMDRDFFVAGSVSSVASFGSTVSRLSSLPLPEINTIGELVRFLQLDSLDELEWLVAPNRFTGLRLQHYRTSFIKKRSGSVRLVESPRSRLKFVQRTILHEILDHVPASDACCGFVKNRNVRDFASVHCEQGVVLRMDLQDFFPRIPSGRVHAMWRTLGYADEIATYLTWLCTIPPKRITSDELNSIPVHDQSNILEQSRRDRLPQGAPTSGAIANLIAYRMDQRFLGLARKTGGRYSRYADDLAFSWPELSHNHGQQMAAWIGATILECGFDVNFRKTRWMRRGQRQSLAGIIVNESPNIDRGFKDNLRATLFNCVRFGPESQNREQHPRFREYLRGQVAWVCQINPSAGARLMKMFEKVVW